MTGPRARHRDHAHGDQRPFDRAMLSWRFPLTPVPVDPIVLDLLYDSRTMTLDELMDGVCRARGQTSAKSLKTALQRLRRSGDVHGAGGKVWHWGRGD